MNIDRYDAKLDNMLEPFLFKALRCIIRSYAVPAFAISQDILHDLRLVYSYHRAQISLLPSQDDPDEWIKREHFLSCFQSAVARNAIEEAVGCPMGQLHEADLEGKDNEQDVNGWVRWRRIRLKLYEALQPWFSRVLLCEPRVDVVRHSRISGPSDRSGHARHSFKRIDKVVVHAQTQGGITAETLFGVAAELRGGMVLLVDRVTRSGRAIVTVTYSTARERVSVWDELWNADEAMYGDVEETTA